MNLDAKTKAELEEYKKKKKKKEEKTTKSEDTKEEGEVSEAQTADGLDEFTMCEDRVAKAGLEQIMQEYSTELNKVPMGEL